MLEMTKTQAVYANRLLGDGEWTYETAFKAIQERSVAGFGGLNKGWGFALTAWNELAEHERMQRNELANIIRYAQQELASMDSGYRVDTLWIDGSRKRLVEHTAKVEDLCRQLNAYVAILTEQA